MLNFFAPINELGYGVFSHSLIRAYDEYVSKDVALFPMPMMPDFVDESIQRWLDNGVRFKKTDPSILVLQAPWLNRFSGSPMMGLPIFELDIVPDYDLNILRELDVVLQASQWGKKVLENHGLKSVRVVPGGYDPRVFNPDLSLEQKMARIEKQGITFVHVGKFEERKSSEEILKCFIRACNGGETKANLVFHVFNPFDPNWAQKANAILAAHGFVPSGHQFVLKNTRVMIPQTRFSGNPKKIYQMGEFGIWASKAEGWNLPLIECIACGRPSITMDTTAQADFIRKGVYPSELVLTSNQKEPTRPGGKWWPVNEEELTQKIKNVIQDPKKYLVMEKACLESIKDFTWEQSARKLHEVIKSCSK